MARLDFLLGDTLVMRVALIREAVVIGRHKWCEVQLPDTKVSRFHVKITSAGDGHWAENLSTYGTRLNAADLTDKERLRSGDVLGVGDYTVIYYAEDAPPLDDELKQTLHG